MFRAPMLKTTTNFVLAVLAVAACSSTPKTDTATPDQAAAPAPAPAPEPKPTAKPIPDGWFAVTPQLTVRGVDAAIEFYGKTLGAQKVFALPGPDGKAIHAEIKIGDQIVMLDEENLQHGMKSPLTLGGSPATLMAYVADADATFNGLTAAGAKVAMPLEEQFWGDRFGEVVDPFGHRWAVATHVEDLTPEQMKQRGEIAMAPPKKGAKKPKKGAAPEWKKIAGTPATEKTPKEYHAVTLMLTVPNTAAAIDFYTTVFGAKEKYRMAGPDGKSIMHAEVAIGDSSIMLSDAFPQYGSKSAADLGGSPVAVHFYSTDADAVFARAQSAGANPVMPMSDAFWGDRYGMILDPAGYAWGLATHKEDVTPEQMAERMKKEMEQAKPAS